MSNASASHFIVVRSGDIWGWHLLYDVSGKDGPVLVDMDCLPADVEFRMCLFENLEKTLWWQDWKKKSVYGPHRG